MSRFGIVPVFDVKQLGSSDHDAKNCLLTALQEAIKQVQNVAEPAGTGALTEDTPEACWLCEHLDRVLLYGLQEPQWGYWPWVRKFTHPAAQQEIASLPSVSTDLGYGRAWLLASLNGGLLESYMLSFRQNLRLLRKGYSSNSLLRDPQYLDLLATLLSGLEHIPFSLNQNNALLDDTNAWPKIISYRQSLLHTDEDVVVLPQVWLNYQGFSLTCNSGKKADVATGHAELTRNILSSLDLAVRRTHNGVKCLPSIVSHCSEQLDAMKKLLAHELKSQEDGGLVVKDYRLVHWEKCIQSSPGDYACGPSVGSPLMWRFLEGNARRERKKHWEAGYFLLRAGVLYRFSNQGDTIPSATYLVSGVHCGSCQAVSNVGRPHALQLNLAPSGGACLQLAASNEAEMERWVYALTEAGQASFCGSGSMGGMVACCLVLVGDLVLTLVEGSRVLGVGVIIDLSVVRSENNFCIMEFDGGEAESCAYNWIFWFATEEEKNEFLSIVSVSWQEMFKVPLEVAPMSSGTLRRHCLERASQLEARLNDSRAFCLDI
ncbi:pleckstrin homology domain-containing family M member 2-like isoform X2 [Dermacentor andersoni]|uniref:pleckstrin homology domain-containing family M member 2-like isoform X2 n=1 Tax=Dermacentor andersoni TaxID=34620 RepID=UPI0024173B41|nr:pleckstrin homology domain-containing family M member 2-like isoform X3 [Dermacentor andersoni]